MALDKVKDLLNAVEQDPIAQETLHNPDCPSGIDGFIRCCAEAAKRLETDVTEAEIRTYVEKLYRERNDSTNAAVKKVETLADETLEKVAGGYESCYNYWYEPCIQLTVVPVGCGGAGKWYCDTFSS